MPAIPTEIAQCAILQGFTLGDLRALCRQALGNAHERSSHSPTASSLTILPEDAHSALDQLQAARAQSIGAPRIPNVQWADVNNLVEAKQAVVDTIELVLQRPGTGFEYY